MVTLDKQPIESQLVAIRTAIDQIDQQLQELITERANLALQVGAIKQSSGSNQQDFYRPEREAQILQQIIKRNKGPLTDIQVISIFRSLLTACLSLQQPIKVAFLGPAGTFSQAAVMKHFGHDTAMLASANIERVFREVEAGHANYGVVPIENSSAGVVHTTLDTLMNSPLQICGEIILPIHQHLMAASSTLTNPRRIYGHEQSLAQCQRWLAANMPMAELIATSSNAAGAQRAVNEADAAAIAGDLAAHEYGLTILVKNIEDNPQNETRFLILGQQKVKSSGKDKTSLLISTPHTPGSLIELIRPFADNQINISLIESRPYRDRNWSYLFFIDIEGHQEDEPVKQALAALASKSIMLNILGSYPKAIL